MYFLNFISKALGFFDIKVYFGLFLWSFVALGLFLIFYHAFIKYDF